MRIKYAIDAIHDLERLRAFIEIKNPHVARRIAAELLDGIENLASFPELGLPVRRAPNPNVIRDLFVGKYTIRYLRQQKSVVVLRVWHGKEAEKDL